MATAQRDLIVENVKTTLEGITTIATPTAFRITVHTVEKVIKHWDEVNRVERPWIGFVTGRTKLEYQPGNVIRAVLPFQLLAYIDAATQDLRATLLSDLEDDLIVALNADQSRGGNAVMTTIREIETDEGEEGGDGVLWMNFDVTYFRGTSPS